MKPYNPEYDSWWPPIENKQKEMQRLRLLFKYANAFKMICYCARQHRNFRRHYMWLLAADRLDRKLHKLYEQPNKP